MTHSPPNTAFVHVIESPSSSDLLDGRTEGRTLCSFLELAGVPCWYNLVTNQDALLVALGERLVQGVKFFGAIPILHFSMHGNNKGIELTDFTFLEWVELSDLLRPINQAVQGKLIVSLSACSGAAGSVMAFSGITPLPMETMIATKGTPTWQEATVAFVVFYHHLFNLSSSVTDAVAAMKSASAHREFVEIKGQVLQDIFHKIVHMSSDDREQFVQEYVRLSGKGGV